MESPMDEFMTTIKFGKAFLECLQYFKKSVKMADMPLADCTASICVGSGMLHNAEDEKENANGAFIFTFSTNPETVHDNQPWVVMLKNNATGERFRFTKEEITGEVCHCEACNERRRKAKEQPMSTEDAIKLTEQLLNDIKDKGNGEGNV